MVRETRLTVAGGIRWLALGAIAAILALAVSAHPAAAATFQVNENSDGSDESVGDGRCDADEGAPGRQCSLRAALAEANDRQNADRIEFDHTVFDGTHPGSTIVLSIPSFLPVGSEVVIDAGDCGSSPGSHRPCVGIDAGANVPALAVSADDVVVKGIAFHGTAGSALRGLGADGLVVRNSWFGLRVDGFPDANSSSIALDDNGLGDDTDGARIGGKRARHANTFSGGSVGVGIRGGDRNRIAGNRFGVNGFGISLATTVVPVLLTAQGTNNALKNQVGTKLSKRAARSSACDGGCNAITNGAIGIALGSDSENASRRTKVRGNFIGLTPSGQFSMANSDSGINLATSHATTVGGGKRARNFIVGGQRGIASDAGVSSALVKKNWIGFNSAGERLDPPDGSDGSGCQNTLFSVGELPSRFVANHIAPSASSTALCLRGGKAEATRNVIGIAPGGGELPVQLSSKGISAVGSSLRVGRPGQGNVLGGLSASGSAVTVAVSGPGTGSGNRIQGNHIGVTPAGNAHPIAGDGIGLQGQTTSNVVGGNTAASENVISNVSGSAILVSALGTTPAGNRIMRNRGRGNGTASEFELFVNLRGTTGFGNDDPGLHDGIEAPVVTDVRRRRAEGTARPGAVVYVFETKGTAGASPNRLDGYLAKAVAGADGAWTAAYERIAANRRVTALQLRPTDGSSELALAVDP